MIEEKTDILIIGGGIAGLTLAKYLAEDGIDFILVEKNKEFFKKACGEGITVKLAGYNFFDLYESKKGIERITDSTIVYTKYGKISMDIPNIVCNKQKVEEELAYQAEKRGGTIRRNSKVSQIKRHGERFIALPQNIGCKIVVGADGVNSLVRKYLNLPKPNCGIGVYGITENIDKSSDNCHIEFIKGVIPHGYSWFFPKTKEWNIGIGTANPQYFKDSFLKFMNRFPEVKKWKGGFVPMSMPLKSYGDRMILVGDAASQVIAMLGDGILPSMICARIAANHLIEISKNDFREIDLSLYEKTWHNELFKIFKSGYTAYNLLSKVQFSEYIFHLLIKMMCKMAVKEYNRE